MTAKINVSEGEWRYKYMIDTRNNLETGVYTEMCDEINISMKDKKVLDIGCGPGEWLVAVSASSPSMAVGGDLDDKWLKVASDRLEKLEKIYLMKLDACHLPFKNNSFDIVICYLVMPYVIEDNVFIREIARVLKEQGRLLIGTHGMGYPLKRIMFGGGRISAMKSILSTILYNIFKKKIYADTFQPVKRVIKLLNNYDIQAEKVYGNKFMFFPYIFRIIGFKNK